ncbi:MAG: hypothetical protein PWR01_3715 [Clostridiales bacterium]|jgi:uncharacterized protein YaaR (DUF327 family)|nr:hypothetical protein [Clostridiales bacterium]MDN5282642.1 hypothetical protein [Candidatus Ozemobacter sp.]
MAVKVSNRNIESGKPSGKSGVAPGKGSDKAFTGKLKEARVQILGENLDELAKVVKERGDTFLKSPEEGLLKSYKESIKQFLAKVSKEFLALKEEFGAAREGEQKVFQLVKSTDSEVESLTKETLTQSRAVGLLASLDDIRGLVLDIMG